MDSLRRWLGEPSRRPALDIYCGMRSALHTGLSFIEEDYPIELPNALRRADYNSFMQQTGTQVPLVCTYAWMPQRIHESILNWLLQQVSSHT